MREYFPRPMVISNLIWARQILQRVGDRHKLRIDDIDHLMHRSRNAKDEDLYHIYMYLTQIVKELVAYAQLEERCMYSRKYVPKLDIQAEKLTQLFGVFRGEAGVKLMGVLLGRCAQR